jgi:hypothetical protein
MKTVLHTLVIAMVLTGVAAAQGRQAAPPAPAAPAAPAAKPAPQAQPPEPGQLVNVRVDVVVVEEGGTEPPTRKEVSLVLADRRAGSVRSGARAQNLSSDSWVNVDARPWLERNGRIRTLVTMGYASPPHFSRGGDMKFEPLLEDGKPLVVSRISSAISERRVTIEVTATILK